MTQEQIENKVNDFQEQNTISNLSNETCDTSTKQHWLFRKLAELELRIEALESLNNKP